MWANAARTHHAIGLAACLSMGFLFVGFGALAEEPETKFCAGVLLDAPCAFIVRLPSSCAGVTPKIPKDVNLHYFPCERDHAQVMITLADAPTTALFMAGAHLRAAGYDRNSVVAGDVQIDAPSGRWEGVLERSTETGDLVRAAVRTRHNLGLVDVVIEFYARKGQTLSREDLEAMVRSLRWMRSADPEVGKPYDEAWEALKVGKLEKAVKLYDKALARDPNHAASWTEKARALRQLGLLDEAVAAHRKALELLPDDFIIKSDLINVLRDRAVRRSPGGGAVLDDADLTLLKHLYPDALACEDPERQRTQWVIVGWLLTGSAANDDAIRILEEAINRWPQDVVAWTDLGRSYRAAGRLKDAVRCFCEGMRLASGGPRADQNYAKTNLDEILKRYPELVEDPKRSTAICETLSHAGSAAPPTQATTPE